MNRRDFLAASLIAPVALQSSPTLKSEINKNIQFHEFFQDWNIRDCSGNMHKADPGYINSEPHIDDPNFPGIALRRRVITPDRTIVCNGKYSDISTFEVMDDFVKAHSNGRRVDYRGSTSRENGKSATVSAAATYFATIKNLKVNIFTYHGSQESLKRQFLLNMDGIPDNIEIHGSSRGALDVFWETKPSILLIDDIGPHSNQIQELLMRSVNSHEVSCFSWQTPHPND